MNGRGGQKGVHAGTHGSPECAHADVDVFAVGSDDEEDAPSEKTLANRKKRADKKAAKKRKADEAAAAEAAPSHAALRHTGDTAAPAPNTSDAKTASDSHYKDST